MNNRQWFSKVPHEVCTVIYCSGRDAGEWRKSLGYAHTPLPDADVYTNYIPMDSCITNNQDSQSGKFGGKDGEARQKNAILSQIPARNTIEKKCHRIGS